MVINKIYEERVLRIVVGILALILLLGGASATTFSIEFGETKSEYINSTAEMDTFTFSANAGDRILIRMDSGWVNGPEIRLFAPNGTLIYHAPGYVAGYNTYVSEITTESLPDSGVYTILAGDNAGDNTGKYGLYLQRLNNPGNATPIGFGETKSSFINSTAEMDTYTFSTCSGDKILIRMDSDWLNGPEIRLLAPDGTLIYYAPGYVAGYNTYVSEITTESLPDSGFYTILAGDNAGDNTGKYGLFLQSTSSISCITVISPNGGENWTIGTTRTISWTSHGSTGVLIELLKDGVPGIINSSTPNNGSYNWAIPLSQTTGTDYKMRVTSTTNSAYNDTSDNNFTISSIMQKGDLNNNGISADAGDLVLMKRASIAEILADSRYDLNNNGQLADAGDLVIMKRASIGEINL